MVAESGGSVRRRKASPRLAAAAAVLADQATRALRTRHQPAITASRSAEQPGSECDRCRQLQSRAMARDRPHNPPRTPPTDFHAGQSYCRGAGWEAHRRHTILLAERHVEHPMVVKHEMSHALGVKDHPARPFAEAALLLLLLASLVSAQTEALVYDRPMVDM